jgi:hypothetical protein
VQNAVILVVPLCSLFIALLGFQRVLRRIRGLHGERRKLTRDVMISAFVGALCASFAALAYVVWFYSRNELLLASAIMGAAIFVLSAAWCTRSSLRLNKLSAQ